MGNQPVRLAHETQQEFLGVNRISGHRAGQPKAHVRRHPRGGPEERERGLLGDSVLLDPPVGNKDMVV